MSDLTQQSPLGVYVDHLKKGELAYQICKDDNKAFFYPRAFAPETGSENLEWRVSKGIGTVYTTTVIYYKGEAPLNVAMIDMDEGYRLMSRVEDIDAMQVKIGMRVKVKVNPGDEKTLPFPVFTALIPDPSAPLPVFPGPGGRRETSASPPPPGEGPGVRDGRSK